MRSTLRLTLSSYVVVLAACASAGAPSTPGSGGVIQQGNPGRSLAAAPVRFSRARTGLGDTLAVRVQGPPSVKAEGSVQFTAAVENSRASRHYYWWFVASCARSAGC